MPDTAPAHRVTTEPCAKRIRVIFNGETVADTVSALLLFEPPITPVYYIPLADIPEAFRQPTDHATHCPFKGDATYWNIVAGDQVAENALWSYPNPVNAVPELKGHAAFYWNRMDQWLEEDEEIHVHARDPHVRLDILPSSRRVEVRLNGTVLADSTRALFLFETGLPVRYYLPAGDVAQELLSESNLETACPYKGVAAYHHLNLNGMCHENLVWHYANPVREAAPIRDRLCFYNEQVDISVNGLAQPRPRTKWSPG